MKRLLSHRWFRLIVWTIGGALVVPARVWAHGSSEGGAGTDNIEKLFNFTLLLAIPVFILVEGLLVYAMVRYRRRRADEVPEQVEGNTPLEIAWTVLSFAIIAVLFFLTYRALQTDYRAEADREDSEPYMTVRVNAHRFYWRFYYELPGVDMKIPGTTNDLYVPVGQNILLEITSADVIHSFWVPDLAGKVDAIPGYVNTMWLPTPQVGTYDGECAEYCGTLHWNMPIHVHVLEQADFDEWIVESTAFKPVGTDLNVELPAGDPQKGDKLFHSEELNCIGCHAAEDGVGPALTGLGARAEDRREGYSAELYLHEAIVDPCAYDVAGFNCEVMPHDYGERLNAQMLVDLIAYLAQHE